MQLVKDRCFTGKCRRSWILASPLTSSRILGSKFCMGKSPWSGLRTVDKTVLDRQFSHRMGRGCGQLFWEGNKEHFYLTKFLLNYVDHLVSSNRTDLVKTWCSEGKGRKSTVFTIQIGGSRTSKSKFCMGKKRRHGSGGRWHCKPKCIRFGSCEISQPPRLVSRGCGNLPWESHCGHFY